jgi:hypothetical protein
MQHARDMRQKRKGPLSIAEHPPAMLLAHLVGDVGVEAPKGTTLF